MSIANASGSESWVGRKSVGVVFVILSLSAISSLPHGTAALSPQATTGADAVVLTDSFETQFPSTTWSVGDGNPASGTDTWATTNYRAEAGVRSAWAAGIGNRTGPAVAFTEDFESIGAGTDWTVDDSDPNYGEDYWGLSDSMANLGFFSFWCGQNGYAGEWGDEYTNVEVGAYDDSMNTTMTHPIDLSGFSSAMLTYSYYMDIEPGYDYFWVIYYDGGWNYINRHNGASSGWTSESVALPVGTTMFGFMFTSDESVIYPGVWVDSIQVTGERFVLNTVNHRYDDGMDATMSRPVTLTGYETASLQYSFWSDTESGHDYLEAGYLVDKWYYPNRHEGATAAWQVATLQVPIDATRIGFRFVSDGDVQGEGAYVDDLQVIGHVGPVLCSVGVSPTQGIEGSTNFYFSVDVSGGFRPYLWWWDFGDGRNSTAPAPEHIMDAVGTYSPTLTVRDSLGQACQASTAPVTIDHDLSAITVSPPSASIKEGGSVSFGAFDARGHALDFAWSVSPPECGSITMDVTSVVFESSTDAGGLACVIRATYGGVAGVASVTVAHDLTAPSLSPSDATVVERGTLELFARDTYGHPADASWLSSCGRVHPATGPSTVFSASTNGGNTCIVTAQVGQGSVTSRISVLHDTTVMHLTPLNATLVEGASTMFSVSDRYDHAIAATWSVAPASCGQFTTTSGSSTSLLTSPNAGGLTCSVSAFADGNEQVATVLVKHDQSSGAISPLSASAVGGSAVTFTALDAHGHAAVAVWGVTPSACGSFLPSTGETTQFTSNAALGGATCTVTASLGSLLLSASMAVTLGAPAVIEIQADDVEEGGAAGATARVLDGNGHVLDASQVAWTTDCAGVSPARGVQTTVSGPEEGAGSTCSLTATLGAATKTLEIDILHARPYTVTVTPAAQRASAGGTQGLSLTVVDGKGHALDASAVVWSTNCGAVTGSTGSATFTAPAAGGTCRVTATVTVGGVEAIGQTDLVVEPASSVPVIAGAGGAVAAAGVGAFLFLRKKRNDAVRAPSEAPAPEQP